MTIQTTIINEMKVLPNIDPKFEINRRIQFIKNMMLKSHSEALILGISGGVDSSTCGRIAQLAIEQLNLEQNTNKYKFIAVRLPYAEQKDESDAQQALDFIQPSVIHTVNIHNATDALHAEVLNNFANQQLDCSKVDFVKGNLKARLRMCAQYEIAALYNGLVLGTDHSAENITGFYTKFGDGACDLAPLFGLNKRQVRLLASHLGAPSLLIHKTPTADLESLDPQKSDESVLGLSYDDIDDYLEGKVISSEKSEKLEGIYCRTMHKREEIPTIYN
ncbi:NH(3)-dependent NAD(+) synthetase [Paraphotobacterium marinum]